MDKQQHKKDKLDENLQKKIEEMENDLKKVEGDYLRMAADYSNLVKRSEQEKKLILEIGNEKLLKDLLEVLDDLEASAEHTDDAGIKNINIKLKKVLESQGLEEIDALNNVFDPNMHEAIESTEGPENQVVKVFRKGYKTKNKILRPSLVSVGNGTNSKNS